MVHIYNEYYSGIKRNAFEPVLMRWTNLEPITKSEIKNGDSLRGLWDSIQHTHIHFIGLTRRRERGRR